MKKLTKKEVLQQVREMIKECKIPHGDSIAKREFFNNYIDSLQKDGYLTEYQVNTWSNPF